MIRLLLVALFCAIICGCSSPRYSDRTVENFHEAKSRVSQLRTGMTRAEVESILQAKPQKPPAEWDNTGYLPVSYRLYPGIWVHVDYMAPRYILLQLPTYLDVALNRNDKPIREFTRIPLNQIR